MFNLADCKYYVDLHVHTRRYSPCAELLDPELLVNRLRYSRLDGIVVTEHDNLWSREEIRELNAGLRGKRFYRGVEVSSSLGHFVVIGLDDLDGIEPGVSIDRLVQGARKSRAAVILVHNHLSNYTADSHFNVQSIPYGIDAIEVASTITFGANQLKAESLAKDKGWSQVAGSDAHCIDRVGHTFTAFPELPADEKTLAKAICMGMGVPLRADDSVGS